MKLYKIVRKVASNLMPPGTLVERMTEGSNIEIGEKVMVQGSYKSFLIFAKDLYFIPEFFRVVKETER